MEARLKAARGWFLRWVVIGVIWSAALLVGGVAPGFVAGASVVCGTALALGPGKSDRRTALVAAGLLGLAVYCALQCVPLPLELLGRLSPRAAEVWAASFELSDVEAFAPLSLEPEATRLEAAKYALYAAVWLLAARFAWRKGLRRSVFWVYALASLVAVVWLVHRVLEPRLIYGFYEPYAATGQSAPLLNPNNLAGLLNLGVFTGLGWSLHPRTRTRERSLGLVGVSALAALTFSSGSRAGAAVLVAVGLALLLVLAWQLRARLGRARWVALLAGVGFGALLFGLALDASLERQLWSDDLQKLELTSSALSIVERYPWFGLGRGAVVAELPRWLPSSLASETLFLQVESWPLEWVCGLGVPIGGLVVCAVLVLFWPRRTLCSDACRTACYGGVVAVLVQNLLDNGLEVPGLALPWLFVTSALLTAPARGAPERASSALAASARRLSASGARQGTLQVNAPLWRRAVSRACAGGAALATLWLCVAPPSLAHHEHRELTRTLEREGTAEQRLALVEAALRRHPGDAYVLRLGALVLADAQRPEALAWLNRSLVQNPAAGRSYLLLADTLRGLGRTEQGVASLRHGIELQPSIAGDAVRWARRHAPTELEQLLPNGEAASRVALELAASSRTAAERSHWLERARQRSPQEVNTVLAMASDMLRAVLARQAPCDPDRERCLSEIRAALVEAERLGASAERLLLPRARLWVALGEHRRAFDALLPHCAGRTDRDACTRVLLEAAVPLELDALSVAAERYLDAHCGTREACASAERHVAAVYRSRQLWSAALSHAERAAQQSPSWAAWLEVSQLARLAERREHARSALDRARALAPASDAAAEGALRAMDARLSTP